jgi:hypothetical protein
MSMYCQNRNIESCANVLEFYNANRQEVCDDDFATELIVEFTFVDEDDLLMYKEVDVPYRIGYKKGRISNKLQSYLD